MTLAIGLLAYRLSIADWHWEWPWEHLVSTSAGDAYSASSEPVARSTPTSPVPEPSVDLGLSGVPSRPEVPASQDDPVAAVDATPQESVPELKEPNHEAALALSDIEKESERIRREREELEKAKEQAGQEMAEASRRPGFARLPDRALLARRQADLEQLMRQQMLEHRRAMERMLRAQRGFAGRGRMPGLDDRFDRGFEQMRREMEAFEREAETMMREHRAFAFGMPGRGGVVIPPAPDFDVPPPPAPDINVEDDADETEPARPKVRRRTFVTPDGVRIQTLEMRWGMNDS